MIPVLIMETQGLDSHYASDSRIHFLKDLESHACSRKIITVPWVREQAGKRGSSKKPFFSFITLDPRFLGVSQVQQASGSHENEGKVVDPLVISC